MLKNNLTGFYDLNVSEVCFENAARKNTLETLLNLGYRTIAVNQIIDLTAPNPQLLSKKKKKGENLLMDCVPQPFNLEQLNDIITKELKINNVNFLNRLTLIFAEQDTLQKYLKSSNFKKYDLVAVTPTTASALTFICSNLEADILSFDPQNKFNLKLNRKMYGQLVEKGFHLELIYSAAIQDSTKRKNLIRLSHLYHTYGKSKNVIFSSGADNFMLIRGPYDIINLGFLFGLNELQSKSAILHYCRNVILNSIKRRHGKGLMLIENIQLQHQQREDESVIILSDIEETDNEPQQKKSKI